MTVYPPALTPGSRVHVVAPSGPFDKDLLKQGIERLSRRYRVDASQAILAQPQGFLADDDAHRLRSLQSALDDPEVDAIFLARGGYGLTRILPRLSFDRIKNRPKWFVGFSDGTVLHQRLYQNGLASIHGANTTTVARSTELDHAALVELLERREVSLDLNEASELVCRGELVGGNLTMLFTEAASGRLERPKDAVIFIEDVSETSYRVDRMLTALLDFGYFEGALAVLVGEFTDCSAGKFNVSVEDVVRERLHRLPVPVFHGLPIGHGARNFPLVHGGNVDLDGPKKKLSFGPF